MALVRFPLKMADGFNANTLEQLKEHFDIKSVVGYFYDRRLIRWLKINGCAEELSAVEKLSKLDRDLGRKLGEIFGVDGGPEPTLPAWIVEIMNRLKQYTDDKELLAQVEKELLESTAHVAFSQEELDERVTKFDRIYLAGNQFTIPLDETDKTYIGIGESARAVIKSDKIVDFAALNITFEKIRFDDDYQKLIEQSPEKKSEDAKKLYEEGNQAADKDDWSTALEKYKQAAELGYPKAFADIGSIYFLGIGDIEQDINEARRWYKRGMEKNIGEAFGWYALSLNRDDASEDDKREAFRCMKRATELAPESGGWWNKLGDMYHYGTGTEKNLAKTVECYEKALQFGNSWAANSLGFMYDKGEYVEQNPRKAFELYKQAIELEDRNTAAVVNLACCYLDGDGIEKNSSKAFELFKQAAEAGDVDAMAQTAYMLIDGEGTRKDEYESFRWLKKSVDEGNTDGLAIRNLAISYRCGIGTEENPALAFKYFKQAAEAGDVDAMADTADMLINGEGTRKDEYESFRWLKKSVDSGNDSVIAIRNLATCYRCGTGTPKDPSKAVPLFYQAADAGDIKAIITMGELFRNGEGVDKNFKEALRYFQRAANEGNAKAMNYIALIYDYGGYGVTQDGQQAFQWYKKSAEAGYPNGMSNLSLCYLWGNGVHKKLSLAEHWMKKAAEAGAYYGMLQYANWLASENKRHSKLAAMYEQVANAGYGEAAYKLSMMYLNGWGVAQSDRNYEYWLHKSQELGYEPE